MAELISAAINQNIDFQAAFSDLGQAVSDGKPIAETLGELYVNVFRPDETEAEPVAKTGYCISELNFMADGQKNMKAVANRRLTILENDMASASKKKSVAAGEQQTAQNGTAASTAPAPSASPTSSTSPKKTATAKTESSNKTASPKGIDQINYKGKALPAGTSMKKEKLNFIYSTPVLGVIASGFGYRSHPLYGDVRFHNGVDIAANTGTPIKAFADGTVDYIGESAIYGLYTRVSHADHTTSFYAHCSKLLVQKGQKVKLGEVIAKAGATGDATGPHLHFEIRKNGTLLNPLYYIDRRTK
ncbi:MAG: M23 family metallopeptidase [Oscillospiraceae bacterium]|nr:M23 family metallopeptidase [Oscillospiraceae bacterium]